MVFESKLTDEQLAVKIRETDNANRIMIGEMPRFERPTTTPESFQNGQEGQPQPDQNIGDRQRFGNNTDRPQFDGQRQAGAGRGVGSMMLQGEILKMDTNNFILKTEKEGTKMIYFTAGTEIYIIFSSTPKETTTTSSNQ